jgi:hypothetical protein
MKRDAKMTSGKAARRLSDLELRAASGGAFQAHVTVQGKKQGQLKGAGVTTTSSTSDDGQTLSEFWRTLK